MEHEGGERRVLDRRSIGGEDPGAVGGGLTFFNNPQGTQQ
jgi:hypothetical protein